VLVGVSPPRLTPIVGGNAGVKEVVVVTKGDVVVVVDKGVEVDVVVNDA